MDHSTRGTDATRSEAPTQPERGADRNRRELTGDDATAGVSDPVLPSLDDGLTLLDVDGRGVPVLQSLALDHLLTTDGPAFWVDTAGCARTTTLARVAPSWRLLERVHVSRGFTPYKHHAAVADVPDVVSQITTETAAVDDRDDATATVGTASPALLVAPVVDGRYRDADDLPHAHARQVLARTLARLRRYADAYDAPVLLTRTTDGDGTGTGVAGSGGDDRTGTDADSAPTDGFATIVANAADHRLRCERTPQGPRFVGDDQTETLVYPQPDGTLQTTLAYWRTILDQRATAAGIQTDGPTPTADTECTPVASAGEHDAPDEPPRLLATDATHGPGAGREFGHSLWSGDR